VNSIHLVDGFQANIQIKDKQGAILWQKPLAAKEEVMDFIKQNSTSKPGWSSLFGTVTPLRTQNLKDFSKDLFFPTFVNSSLKINNLALKIIASIFAVALDVVTLPLRLLTTPYRIYYNYKNPEAEHPLTKLLNENQGQKKIDEDVVRLCYEVQNVQMDPPTEKNGERSQEARGHTITGTMKVALKRLPGEKEFHFDEKVESAGYFRGYGEEWVVNGNYSRVESRLENFELDTYINKI
jgi:hypothetical protein